MKRNLLSICILFIGWHITAQITKVETYQIGTQIDYYIGECENTIPEAQGKLSFCDRVGNLAVVQESLGLNGRGTLALLPNYYNDSEVYVTRNGISIYHQDGSWENIPNVAFANPELSSWNNNATATGGVLLPDGKLLIYANQAGQFIQKYDLITKELTLSVSTSTTGNGFPAIRNITYDPQTGKTYTFMISGGNRYLYEYVNNSFVLLNDSSTLFEVFPSTNVVTTVIKDGVLYSGSTFGLFTIDLSNPGQITKYDATDTGILPFNKVNDFVIAEDGMIWMAQQASTNNAGGVTKFDSNNETFEVYTQENPGNGVVDVLPSSIALNPNGIVHISTSNVAAVADLEFSSGTAVWDFIEFSDFDAQGVPITFIPSDVYVVDGVTYYITNDFSSGNTNNYEVAIRNGDIWTGRNDNAPGNISFRMIERFREAHPTSNGGSIWSNSLDDIIVTIDGNDNLTPEIKFQPSGAQGAVDSDNKYVQNIGVPGEGSEVRKLISPIVYEYLTENNGGDRSVAQYNDQIWVYNQDARTIEIYLQDTLIQTYDLDPSISLSSYFRCAVDANGIFWAVKSSFPSASLLRFDRTTGSLTEIALTSDFGPLRGIEVAPDGGIWLLSSTDAIFYKDAIEYAFPNDLLDSGNIQDGQVDMNGKIHILTVGTLNGDIHTIENPTAAEPIIESINLVNNTNESLLPTENTNGADDIIIDTDGDYWINSLKGFYKIIDDDSTPYYRTNEITKGIISGRLYGDINDNGVYDNGEQIAGVSVSIVVNGEAQKTVSDGEGIYRILAQAENTEHTVVVNTLDDDYFLLDRTQQVAVSSLDQNYENNDFVIDVKDYNSIFYKQGQRIGVWGFDRAAFENTFTLAITNMSTTKTFNELGTTFLFENKDGGELPEIADVTFTKVDPNGLTQLHSKIAINPKNGRWSLPAIPPNSYTITEDTTIPFTLTEETGKRRVLFTIPEILPLDTWIVEIKTDLFDPAQSGVTIVHTIESTSSPNYENPPAGGDIFILYPEEDRDFDDVPLPSEDPNSPYVDPFDPENNIYTEPKDVYAPSPYESPLYSAYDPNDKLVDGGNTLEINETDIARKWLTYTIRFENTGNFSAKDVYILDELDENIIPNSFTLLEASTAVEIDFLPSGENVNSTLRFSFNDIFLPFDDENNDGWIKFRVRVKDDIAEETIVSNTVEIYFDQNPAIITNTIQNLFRTPEEPADTEAPNVVCKNITVFLNQNGETTIQASDVDDDSTDNVGIETLEIDITTFDCTNLGENTVVLTATDAAGNTSSCTAIVTVEDEFPPQMECVGSLDLFLDENGVATITVDDIDNGTTDNCGISELDIDITSFDCNSLGENIVTLSATDTAGFTTTCTTIVTVIDNVLPAAICQNITVQLDDQGQGNVSVDQINNGSTDNCGDIGLDLSQFSFTCDDIGMNTVTLFVTDSAGNQNTCEAIVTVVDETPPNIICSDITIALNEDGIATIVPSDIDQNDSTDNCGILESSLSATMFTCDEVGDNTILFTVTDMSGNTSTCDVIVTVIDDVLPFFDENTLPQDQTVTTNDVSEYEVEDFTLEVLFADNCDVVISQDPVSGAVLTLGVYDFTITIVDASGNETAHLFEVTVDETLSTDENVSKPLLVFPNPVIDMLTIESDDNVKNLKLYDLSGRIIFRASGLTQIDMSSLPASMYILEVQLETRLQIIKILKQ